MKLKNSLLPFGQSSLALGMCLIAGGVSASPIVTGTTISWPSDGWYQVQTADGSSTVCSGGSSCDVSPGTYVVINHSTGQRFSDIVVSGSSTPTPTPSPTGVTVSGSTISWPDDGWYQVQTADGTRNVCEGGTSCDVDPGLYLLINHTTGERFSDVEVSGGSSPTTPTTPPASDTITVTGSVISWPDDGWYQVQSADGTRNVCEGGTSCEVSAGSYKLINHSTGETFYDIVVGGSAPVSPPTTPVTPPAGVDRVTVDGTTISWPDDGWYQIQNADTYSTVCEGGRSCDVAVGSYIVINHNTGDRQTVSVAGTGGGTTPPVEITPPVDTPTVLVDFNITVPTFASDALQVQVLWGDTSLPVAWLFDETWAVTGEFTPDTEQPLTITFFDDNGAITLASFETSFRTNSDAVQDYQVTADLFNSERWDSDSDGTSNLDELRSGRDPFIVDVPDPTLGDGDSDYQITLANRESGTINVSVGIPDPEAGELGGDFMILFDRSGSFGDDLSTFRREVNEIELALAESFSNFRVGLGSFVDAPCEGFGYVSDDDFGYELNQPMSPPGTLSETLSELDIRYGGDGPESQLEAMRQAMTGEGHVVDADLFPSCSPVANIMASSPGWVGDRVRFLLVSTDAAFHRPTDFNYPYQTSVEDVINIASESKTTILFLNSGSSDSESSVIAESTGGTVSNLGSASQEVVTTLKSAVASTITSVEVSMKPVGEGAEFVTSIDPERVELNLFEDRNVDFQVNLLPALRSSDEDRVFNFELITEAQGAEISRLTVQLIVPADS